MLLFFSKKKMERHQTLLHSEGKKYLFVDLKAFMASHRTVEHWLFLTWKVFIGVQKSLTNIKQAIYLLFLLYWTFPREHLSFYRTKMVLEHTTTSSLNPLFLCLYGRTILVHMKGLALTFWALRRDSPHPTMAVVHVLSVDARSQLTQLKLKLFSNNYIQSY